MKKNLAISIKNLSKTYSLGQSLSPFSKSKKTLIALDKLNLDIKIGENIGIIGANGSGKSTLLKILSKIISPTNGEVFVRGKVGALLQVGAGFHDDLSGRENIYLNASLYGMSDLDENLFNEIVSFAEIDEMIDSPIKFYSSGMKIRLGFSISLHLLPDILLLDETLSVGDFSFKKKCHAKLSSILKQKTVVLVSHSMDEIIRNTAKCIVLDKGKIIFQGKSIDAVRFYENNNLTIKDDPSINFTNNTLPFFISGAHLSSITGKKINYSNFKEESYISVVLKHNKIVKNYNKYHFGVSISDATGNVLIINKFHIPNQKLNIENTFLIKIPSKLFNPGLFLIRPFLEKNSKAIQNHPKNGLYFIIRLIDLDNPQINQHQIGELSSTLALDLEFKQII